MKGCCFKMICWFVMLTNCDMVMSAFTCKVEAVKSHLRTEYQSRTVEVIFSCGHTYEQLS